MESLESWALGARGFGADGFAAHVERITWGERSGVGVEVGYGFRDLGFRM